jgi:hypothetical protein
MNTTKQEYSEPALLVYGGVAQLTQQGQGRGVGKRDPKCADNSNFSAAPHCTDLDPGEPDLGSQ